MFRPAHGKQWATSAQSLILAVFGETSLHYTNFVAAFKNCSGYVEDLNMLNGIFIPVGKGKIGSLREFHVNPASAS